MPEKIIHFPAERLTLEGLLHRADGERGVVITHPHPLYGGDMYNPVVETLSRAYQEAGYSTLRFNFRGVGGSGGGYGGGQDERADVAAALDYLRDQGKTVLDLAGYSFGAWVSAQVEWDGGLQRMILVSPPVGFAEFRDFPNLPELKGVLTGSSDPIAPAKLLEKQVPQWNPSARLVVIDGADHFFSGTLGDLYTGLVGLL